MGAVCYSETGISFSRDTFYFSEVHLCTIIGVEVHCHSTPWRSLHDSGGEEARMADEGDLMWSARGREGRMKCLWVRCGNVKIVLNLWILVKMHKDTVGEQTCHLEWGKPNSEFRVVFIFQKQYRSEKGTAYIDAWWDAMWKVLHDTQKDAIWQPKE